jgi:SAM-dependent methyltransferase
MVMDYTDYWKDNWESRERRGYYDRLYRDVKDRLTVPVGAKVLDVGGGDGHLMHYFGIKDAEILDISDSGIESARSRGYCAFKGDLQKPFPLMADSYDVAFCFEVLEHLHAPEIPISETFKVLKPGGVLYVGQPNMRADGVHHVRRFYKKDIVDLLTQFGFAIEWIDYVPGFIVREAIADDIKRSSSWFRKIKQTVALGISLFPRGVLGFLARLIPDRFCLIFVIRAVKKTTPNV